MYFPTFFSKRSSDPLPPAATPELPSAVGEGAVAAVVARELCLRDPDLRIVLTGVGRGRGELSRRRKVHLSRARAAGVTVAADAWRAAVGLPGAVSLQFAPIDTPAAVGRCVAGALVRGCGCATQLTQTIAKRRFLGHWRPCAAVFVESELWPNALSIAADEFGVPLALVNASARPPPLSAAAAALRRSIVSRRRRHVRPLRDIVINPAGAPQGSPAGRRAGGRRPAPPPPC